MTAGLLCFPDARSGGNPIDHLQRRIPDLEKLEIQKAPGRARRRGGNTWGALRALSLFVALPIGELSTDLLSLRSAFMNSTAVDPTEPASSPVFLPTPSLELNQLEERCVHPMIVGHIWHALALDD